ncbi:hypothetical protein ACHAPU_008445 [Fusarium lateritium]
MAKARPESIALRRSNRRLSRAGERSRGIAEPASPKTAPAKKAPTKKSPLKKALIQNVRATRSSIKAIASARGEEEPTLEETLEAKEKELDILEKKIHDSIKKQSRLRDTRHRQQMLQDDLENNVGVHVLAVAKVTQASWEEADLPKRQGELRNVREKLLKAQESMIEMETETTKLMAERTTLADEIKVIEEAIEEIEESTESDD